MFRIQKHLALWLSVCATTLAAATPSTALPLSPGDRLEVSIPNEKYFARVYEINQAGEIEVPFLGRLPITGLEPTQAEAKLTDALIQAEYFPPGKLNLSMQVLRWAPIPVGVSGEVFQPGQTVINLVAEDDKQLSITNNTQQISGDFPPNRFLTRAIRSAGGILPTADISQIRIVRGNREKVVDLTGIFTGGPIEDIPLVAGDQVIVPAANRYQSELMRPSPITLSGIKVFVSNLTTPASSNASAAINNRNEGITFPYGARFSQAVVGTNCAGGTKGTNANRTAVLVRSDRISGKSIFLERKVEDLLRASAGEQDNPALMPRDAVACYDSNITSTRDVFRSVTDLLGPLGTVINWIF